MRLLLDTHILVNVVEKRVATLGSAVSQALANETVELYVSVASLWEIAIKSRLGKLPLAVPLLDLPALVSATGATLLLINAGHVLTAVQPEPPTRDPFDRLLLSQCEVEGLRLLTIDRALTAHPLAFRSAELSA